MGGVGGQHYLVLNKNTAIYLEKVFKQMLKQLYTYIHTKSFKSRIKLVKRSTVGENIIATTKIRYN